MTTLYLDLETYSETPIKNGVYRYAEDSEILLTAWAIDDGPVRVVDMTDPTDFSLAAFREAFHDPDVTEIVAHNAQFDRVVLERHGYVREIEAWHCTFARALAHSLPGALEKLCVIMRVPVDQAKHEAGKQLVRLFCMPRPKNQTLRRATYDTHPHEWRQFVLYAGNDVEACRVLHKTLPRHNYRGEELALWHLDQEINDRGVSVDLGLARAALSAADSETKRLGRRTQNLTDGAVDSATQRDALLAHLLAEYGVSLPDMQAATLERRIEDPDLPEPVKDLLRIRLMASRTSASKYRTLLNSVNRDGRMRGLLQYCGAMRTGRWAGRLFQPQNLPRTPKYLAKEMPRAIEAIKGGVVDLLYDNPLEVLGAATRGALVAAPGKKLVVADLSNIEGRVLAWLASEWWKVKAFADLDKGVGHDLYALAYANAFGLTPEAVMEDHEAGGKLRLIGKVMELALGYGGAVGAFGTMAKGYGVELAEDAILAVVKGWRRSNPAIVSSWYDLEAKAAQATTYPGVETQSGRIRIRRDGEWLKLRLPSGRMLFYPFPRVEDNTLSYMGVNQYTRKWERITTWGGKLTENLCQSIARDVLAHGMFQAEKYGYRIVLSVHDELITETQDDSVHTAKGLAACMTIIPPWAEGLPLAAAGYEADRYRKG